MSDPQPVPLRRNRDFAKLWVGQFTSTLGSQTSYVAYPLLILGLTGSPLLAGIAGTARAAPQWALGLVVTPVSSSRVMLLGGSGIPGRGRLVV